MVKRKLKAPDPTTQEEMLDIFQAAERIQVSPAYVRLLVRNRELRSIQTPIKEGSRVVKHMIPISELEEFDSRDGRRAPRRNDGRSKYCFYAMPEEMERIKEILYATHDPGLEVVAGSISGKGVISDPWIPPSKQ